MAEGNLSGQADQDIQTDADDDIERHRSQHEDVVAVSKAGENRRPDQNGGNGRYGQESGGSPHTFFTPARPNRPLGLSANATITRPKVTICV
ncbi:hypothetical protein D3C84_1104350 [compost metagenome]